MNKLFGIAVLAAPLLAAQSAAAQFPSKRSASLQNRDDV